MRHQPIDVPVILGGLSAAASYFARCFAYSGNCRETLWVAHVDHQMRVLYLSRDDGDEAHVEFPIRGILIDVVRHRSTGLLLAHNHPSGDARPSDSDLRSTRHLCTAVEALDCTVIDHLIFGDGTYTSFREMGFV